MGSRQMGLKEGVHDQLSSCTCRVEFAGNRYRYWGGVVEKGSTSVGDQGDEQEWRKVIALRRHFVKSRNRNTNYRQITVENLSVTTEKKSPHTPPPPPTLLQTNDVTKLT